MNSAIRTAPRYCGHSYSCPGCHALDGHRTPDASHRTPSSSGNATRRRSGVEILSLRQCTPRCGLSTDAVSALRTAWTTRIQQPSYAPRTSLRLRHSGGRGRTDPTRGCCRNAGTGLCTRGKPEPSAEGSPCRRTRRFLHGQAAPGSQPQRRSDAETLMLGPFRCSST
jgi:hypothetical protein